MTWQTLSLTKPPDITSAAALADLHALATSVGSVLVHPFQYAVGEGERAKLLTFPNAVEALAVKMNAIKPDSLTCIAFASNNIAGLNAILVGAINNTGLGWLLSPQQRAILLNSLEQTKSVMLESDGVPVTVRGDHTTLHIGKLAECYTAKSNELALSESASSVGSIASEITDFESKKATHDSTINAAYAAIDMGSATGYALHLTAGDIATQLREASSPGAEKSQTVIMAFYGAQDDLNIITQWAGL
jgi:hypothetical protein